MERLCNGIELQSFGVIEIDDLYKMMKFGSWYPGDYQHVMSNLPNFVLSIIANICRLETLLLAC